MIQHVEYIMMRNSDGGLQEGIRLHTGSILNFKVIEPVIQGQYLGGHYPDLKPFYYDGDTFDNYPEFICLQNGKVRDIIQIRYVGNVYFDIPRIEVPYDFIEILKGFRFLSARVSVDNPLLSYFCTGCRFQSLQFQQLEECKTCIAWDHYERGLCNECGLKQTKQWLCMKDIENINTTQTCLECIRE